MHAHMCARPSTHVVLHRLAGPGADACDGVDGRWHPAVCAAAAGQAGRPALARQVSRQYVRRSMPRLLSCADSRACCVHCRGRAVAHDVAAALDYLHTECGVLHGDLSSRYAVGWRGLRLPGACITAVSGMHCVPHLQQRAARREPVRIHRRPGDGSHRIKHNPQQGSILHNTRRPGAAAGAALHARGRRVQPGHPAD